jgi:hypothetical protein
MSNQSKAIQSRETTRSNWQMVEQPMPRSIVVRTGVHAGGAERQKCYIGHLSGGVVGADAACGSDSGCWRSTIGGAIDNANFVCINK